MAKQPTTNSFSLVRAGDGWLPADAHADRIAKKYKEGEEITVDRHGISNPKKARYMFQLCRKVVEAGCVYEDPEELRKALIITSGFRRKVRLYRAGEFYREYDEALSFLELSDEDFDRLIATSKRLLAQEMGINVDDVMRKDDGTEPWTGPRPWDNDAPPDDIPPVTEIPDR